MSKIQDALNKLRSNDGTSGPTNSPARGSSLVQPPKGSLRKGSADIQSMREPHLRVLEEISRLRLIDPRMSDEQVLNAFREIRTTILRNVKSKDSVILIAPVIRDAGASFVAMNVAASFSLEEDKTSLVIDCDLRCPSLQKFIINDGNAQGLRDYLFKPDIDVSDIIYPSGIPRLRLLPAGSDGVPLGEYFTTARLRDLMSELRERYPERYIFVDAPPLSESPDARILADVCDSVVLVVPYGKTTELEIESAIEAIGEEKLMGVVFNNAPRTPRLTW